LEFAVGEADGTVRAAGNVEMMNIFAVKITSGFIGEVVSDGVIGGL